MAPNTILPDDPRLTAYALGEMEAEERAEFEQQLEHEVCEVRHQHDLERPAEVRDAAEVPLAGQRDQRGR